MKAVIVAGGKGTRMGNLANEIPKPMLKVGNVPLLEHQIALLKWYGILDIWIITGHLAEVIEDYFKDGSGFGVNLKYFREEKPLGTTGGIKEIENELSQDFVVLYGDVMVNLNLKRLVDFHKAKNAMATLVLHPNDHPFDSDLVEIDANARVTAFYPKPHPENRYFRNLVNAAAYIMSPKILKYVPKGLKADFGRDIFPNIFRSEDIYGYNTAEYLKDLGTPQRLEEVNADYSGGRIGRFNIENKRKAIFLDRDGVINKEINLLYRVEDFELLPGAASAVKCINRSEFLAIVVTNQPVVARNLCNIDELEEIHRKMETLLGRESAKLDGIYYCPHHPDKGYPEENPAYKIDCDCRKPKTGMLKKAAEDFNIDLPGSFFIGDSFRDILCGKAAGVTTIAVGGSNVCAEVKPDYRFSDLHEAVNFIMMRP